MRLERDGYVINDDKAQLDVARIHAWLTASYWAKGIPLDVVQRAIENSDCFGVYRSKGANGTQVAFARVVTDRATFAYLCDVFVDETARGQGLGEWLVSSIHAQPQYNGLRRWMLATRDAHKLYAKLGWTQVTDPMPFMQRHDPDVYTRLQETAPAVE